MITPIHYPSEPMSELEAVALVTKCIGTFDPEARKRILAQIAMYCLSTQDHRADVASRTSMPETRLRTVYRAS
jgi:hypothetical protein